MASASRLLLCLPSSNLETETQPRFMPLSSLPRPLPACSPSSPPLRLFSAIPLKRRPLAAQILSLLTIAVFPSTSTGLENQESTLEYKVYSNESDGYSLLVPLDWIKAQGKATGERNVIAFSPANDVSTNVNVLITAVGADYTSLASFGTADSFAETLVNTLDRSWKKPPGQAAKLISSESKNGFYYIDYTVQKPGEKKRCLLSVVGIRFNGWYNRLYTVNGQFWEEDRDRYGPVLSKVVESFKFV